MEKLAAAGRCALVFFAVALPSTALVLQLKSGVLFYAYLVCAFLAAGWYVWECTRLRFLLRCARLVKQTRTASFLFPTLFFVFWIIFFLLFSQYEFQIAAFFFPEKSLYGDDSDDALLLTAQRILALHYPYDEASTYLGNPPIPLPGAIFLSLPFALVGKVGLQNVVWVLLFWWLFKAELQRLFISTAPLEAGSLSLTFSLFGLTFFLLFPYPLYLMAFGGDRIANALYVTCAVLLFEKSFLQDSPRRVKVFSALLLGVTLSSRLIFLSLLPLLSFKAGETKIKRKQRFVFLGLALLFSGVITLPFYFYSLFPLITPLRTLTSFTELFPILLAPPNFHPLATLQKADFSFFPYSELLFFSLPFLLSAALAVFVTITPF